MPSERRRGGQGAVRAPPRTPEGQQAASYGGCRPRQARREHG